MTNYVKVQNNQIVWGPSPLPQTYTFPDGSTTGDFPYMDASVIKEAGFLPVISNLPNFDASYQTATPQAPVITSDSVTYNWTIADSDIGALKGKRKLDANNLMEKVIYTSVITVEGNNFTMTQNTMLMVNNMASQAANNPNWTGVLQDDAGDFVTLSQSDVLSLQSQGEARISAVMKEAATQVSNINALTTSEAVAQYVISIS